MGHFDAQARVEHQCRQQYQKERHVECLMEDVQFAECLIPYPETGSRPDSREHVCADQEPQQVMMEEVRDGVNRESPTIHFILFSVEPNSLPAVAPFESSATPRRAYSAEAVRPQRRVKNQWS